MLLGGSPCPQARWTPGSSCHPDTTQDPLQCVPQTDPQHSVKYECTALEAGRRGGHSCLGLWHCSEDTGQRVLGEPFFTPYVVGKARPKRGRTSR